MFESCLCRRRQYTLCMLMFLLLPPSHHPQYHHFWHLMRFPPLFPAKDITASKLNLGNTTSCRVKHDSRNTAAIMIPSPLVQKHQQSGPATWQMSLPTSWHGCRLHGCHFVPRLVPSAHRSFIFRVPKLAPSSERIPISHMEEGTNRPCDGGLCSPNDSGFGDMVPQAVRVGCATPLPVPR
jgi:hypothetical protein